uniref:Glucosamine/galactosamine-6-phosphate isomerase domain-containing protein n=1 Tax=Balaenoptera musculus TaxID=9771 RepID=A0A8C0C6R6_BALMU
KMRTGGLFLVFSSPQELGPSLAQLVAQRLARGQGRLAFGLSGGSLESMRAHELPTAAASTRPAGLARWTLGFFDMPLEHCESTDGLQRPHLLSTLPSPANQVITINPALPVEAADSAKKVRQAFQGDSILLFDLLIPGVGPDGTPAHSSQATPPCRSGRIWWPPHRRLPRSLTLPLLKAAPSVVFVVTTAGKADILKVRPPALPRGSNHGPVAPGDSY